jgi:hypothetical protein
MRWLLLAVVLVCGCSREENVEVPIRSSPGGILPRDMNERQWSEYVGNQRAQYYREGQTAYDDGTGFWLGIDSGTAKFSIGNSAGNKLTWNGTTLSIAGQIDIRNTSATFTPASWTGFSAAPSGTISYLNLGALVIMWRDTNLTGTSNDVGMTFTGIPAALRPASANRLVRCLVINGSFTLGGAVEITTSGIAQFYLEDVAGGGAGTADDNKVTPQGSGFENTGTKGIPAGWIIMYSL